MPRVNFSSIRTDSVLGRILRAPLRLLPPDTVLPVLQGRLRGKRWIVGAGNHGCWLGSYEEKKQALFTQHVNAGLTVVDVGANAGFYTLLAAILSGPRGHVVAIEPLARNVRYLRRHLQLNAIENVEIFEAAASDTSGELAFQEGESAALGRLDPLGTLRVRVITLDELVLDGRIPPPDVMKIDIEGGEAAALRGAKETLKVYHPTIFLATHGVEVHQECCDLLRSANFELHALAGDRVETTNELLALHRHR